MLMSWSGCVCRSFSGGTEKPPVWSVCLCLCVWMLFLRFGIVLIVFYRVVFIVLRGCSEGQAAVHTPPLAAQMPFPSGHSFICLCVSFNLLLLPGFVLCLQAFLPALTTAFPGCMLVWCHRSMIDVVPSFASAVGVCRRSSPVYFAICIHSFFIHHWIAVHGVTVHRPSSSVRCPSPQCGC